MAAASQSARQPIAIVHLDHAEGAYFHGMAQPVLRARLQLRLPPQVQWEFVDNALTTAVPEARPPGAAISDEPAAGALERIIHWAPELQRLGLDPVFEAPRLLWRDDIRPTEVVLALPATDKLVAVLALKAVIGLINGGAHGASPAFDPVRAAASELRSLRQTRGVGGSGGGDMMRFLEAAHQRRMPWFRFGAGPTFQIGLGARGRWLQSSFTDATSVIGAKVARNKVEAASAMRQAGLPAPKHWIVADADEAVNAAKDLGYPVVVKPYDLDGGQGVFVGLTDEAGVRKAFGEARKHSTNLLVERFIEGRDYRLVVLHGRLIWAFERVPGGVTGDGKSTVRQLVDALNADPRRGDRSSIGLKKLVFDEEAVERLARMGMDGDSVPDAGERIRLRGVANVGAGGTPVGVFEQVHPDNRRLAERAARALRLDVAGVDLIIPDIGRSWIETGGGICEVNAQPSIGAANSAPLYGRIVESLIEGDGRIPIAVVAGAPADSKAFVLIARIVAAAGLKVGLATPRGVWIDGEMVLPGPVDAFAGGRLLIRDNTVEAALVAVDDTRILNTGLPFDRCAVVALAGSRLANAGAADPAFDVVARALVASSMGAVVINARDEGCADIARRMQGGGLTVYGEAGDIDAVADLEARRGAAIWLDPAAEGARLMVARGADPPVGVTIRGPSAGNPGLTCARADLLLAASVAWALGCGEDALKRGLAGVRPVAPEA
jgi:cyanophycin synthetase